MKIVPSTRWVHYFGYGAERDPAVLDALLGHRPRILGSAILSGFELRIQSLKEIPTHHANPQQIVSRAWGRRFRSYVIRPNPAASVIGSLYKLRLSERHAIDCWELVEEGWYKKIFVEVKLALSGKAYSSETQAMGYGQQAFQVADGLKYSPWLQPKNRFIQIAQRVRQLEANRQ